MAWATQENRYGDDKVYDACGLFGFIDTTGTLHGGDIAITALTNMKERGNGLGAGYAAYGLYPEFADHYCFHVMCRDSASRTELDDYLRRHFAVVHDEPIPSRAVKGILDAPVVWRYFLFPQSSHMAGRDEEDYIVHEVMRINSALEGAFVFSSGKNMGIFKGVGHPEQIAEFYRIHEYTAYLWTTHTRFPTNTPGWWGGAHPFGLLDWSVVHNGEISSYGINRRYLEMHGYLCTMQTDTEVIAYASDLIMRRHKLPPEMAALVFAGPLWDEIAGMPEKKQRLLRAIRQTYGSLLLNGPFTVIIARSGEMIGLGDRIRLRPLTAGIKGNILYVSSELAAIHLVEPDIEYTWTPLGGEAVIGRLGEQPVAPAKIRPTIKQSLVVPGLGALGELAEEVDYV
ncbi:MAG: glutamine amidotransferase family protein [Chloroflexi bacterium]|nr:glutamine amidotransferase family protein [Chloroflexota bacterium]